MAHGGRWHDAFHSKVEKSGAWKWPLESRSKYSHKDRAGKEESVTVEVHRNSTFSSWKEECDILKMAKSKNKTEQEEN